MRPCSSRSPGNCAGSSTGPEFATNWRAPGGLPAADHPRRGKRGVGTTASLDEGDVIAFEIEGDHLVVRKVTPGRDDYLQGLSEVLSEWVSPEDEEAWRDL